MKYRLLPLLLFIGALISCDSIYKSAIPDAPVYLELDLAYRDKDLVPLQASKVYTSKSVNAAYERAGFGGVLIYHTLNDAYVAFDAACPHEALSTVVVQVEEDNLHARCPKCQSRYDLSYGNANPVNTPARQSLRRYNTILSGSRIIVRN